LICSRDIPTDRIIQEWLVTGILTQSIWKFFRFDDWL
jgi:hypothetical protein